MRIMRIQYTLFNSCDESMCCEFFVSFTHKSLFQSKTLRYKQFAGCLAVLIQIRESRAVAQGVMMK